MGHESQRDVGLSSVRGVKCLPTQTGTQGEFSSPSKALMGTSNAAAAPHSACRVQDVRAHRQKSGGAARHVSD